MRPSIYCIATVLLAVHAAGATFAFNTDPFVGSTALTTPGRQVVGGEAFIEFSPASDVFALNPAVFAVGNQISFANDVVANLPAGGVNTIVLRTFDNDNDATTPFNAGTAANLIADQITTPGAGFFIYFNSGLDVPRLVFSTDLSSNQADLKILFRLTNLQVQPGRDAMSNFTASNFQLADVPEPSSIGMVLGGLVGACYVMRRKGVRA